MSPAEQRFQTVPRLRRVQTLQLWAKLVGAGAIGYVVIRIGLGRPLYPIPVLTATLLFTCTAILCFLRYMWGSEIIFQDSAVVILRDSKVVASIPRESIRKLQCKSDTLSLQYHVNGFTRFKVIPREGFSPHDWKALRAYATTYVTPSTQPAHQADNTTPAL